MESPFTMFISFTMILMCFLFYIALGVMIAYIVVKICTCCKRRNRANPAHQPPAPMPGVENVALDMNEMSEVSCCDKATQTVNLAHRHVCTSDCLPAMLPSIPEEEDDVVEAGQHNKLATVVEPSDISTAQPEDEELTVIKL